MEMIPKIVFVGTYPPMQEGIATFNQDLVNAVQLLVGENAECAVCVINLIDTSLYYSDPRVEWEIDQQVKETYLQAADDLNQDDSVRALIIQHEYGIFGGTWGEYVVDFLEAIRKYKIIVMHSVLAGHTESPTQFAAVTRSLAHHSDKIVILSHQSETVLTEHYPESRGKSVYIPHGVPPTPFSQPAKVKKELGLVGKTILTTFGLLSRDKGIEYVLQALPSIIAKHPDVMYQLLGHTHPLIRKKEGESYRLELLELISQLGLRRHVYMLDKYLSLEEISRYLRGTDIYLATSLNPNQAVSGTLSYAASTGRVVVSTDFAQAKEVITPGLGSLVPAKNSAAYTQAINDLLADPSRLKRANRSIYNHTRNMLWTNVALRYIELVEPRWLLPKIRLKHLRKMTKLALFQFAKYDVPDPSYGYTVDDNARALIATSGLAKHRLAKFPTLSRLTKLYFDFLSLAQVQDGSFINYWSHNMEVDLRRAAESWEEPYARAVFSLGELNRNELFPLGLRRSAQKLIVTALPKALDLTYLRPIAVVIKSLALNHPNQRPILAKLAQELQAAYVNTSRANWKWYENKLTYNNGVLVEAMFLAGEALGNREYLRTAIQSLHFLIKQTFLSEVYVPIGQSHWYLAGGSRSYYDQQPEEPCAMILALIAAHRATHKPRYLRLAKQAFSWYLGNNLEGVPLYNRKTGGVYDGLRPGGINKNQGAESLVSYLIARTAVNNYY